MGFAAAAIGAVGKFLASDVGLSLLAGVGGAAAAGAFNKAPSVPKPPPVPPPPPTPEVETEQVRKFQKKRKGRAQTIVTGDLAPTTLGTKTLLGG